MHPSTLPEPNLLLQRLSAATREWLSRRGIGAPLIVGIQTGGLWVAEHLAAALGIDSGIGRLDIGFYRDDYARTGLAPAQAPSALPWPIENRHLLLVDDVLHSGRTVRAALNELFDYGRPASIGLAILVVRDGRELPIEASACGAELTIPAGHELKLRGPNPLRLELIAGRNIEDRGHA
ncbi:MAG: bifunctional pyr operon transcriptional regulator/uracil phosphoribosyltransferase PyrR [Lysobacterales bacterium]